MEQEYKTLAEMVRNRHKNIIVEADNNPDKWYKLFVDAGDGIGTRTVESADTFNEIVKHIATYAEQFEFLNINIDIWECRANSRNLRVLLDTTYRIVRPTLDFSFMLRVASWVSSYNMNEGLSEELFNETYGSVMGKHYYEKWVHVYPLNIMKMIMYFGSDTKEGEKFCMMVMQQMSIYEKRICRNG